jgi:hypothetical protein
MQLTLVSHYGEKPAEFARLVGELQGSLAWSLGDCFCPYEVPQVHGTIIGLEGTQAGGCVRSENFLRYRNETRFIDFAGLLHFLRTDFTGFKVRVGGFDVGEDYGFTSQGRHPFVRSFSLQQEIAVAMGWPIQNEKFSSALDQLRRQMQRFGLLHKWHRKADDVDNDFFFVLGRLDGVLSEERRWATEQELREQLGRREPFLLPINRDALSFVAYRDPQLPLASSRIFRIASADLTPAVLSAVYDEQG